MVSQDKVEEMTKNEEFLREYDIAVDHYESYMNSKDTWFAKNYPNNKEDVIDYMATQRDILETLQNICENSIYSYQKEICEGYITVKGRP
jgi:stage III sporulation protein SpoIIIAA